MKHLNVSFVVHRKSQRRSFRIRTYSQSQDGDLFSGRKVYKARRLIAAAAASGGGGVGEQLWESQKNTSVSANVFVHVCGVALCKGMLELVFLGLCPGPLYYPESVRLCMHRGIDGGRGAAEGRTSGQEEEEEEKKRKRKELKKGRGVR